MEVALVPAFNDNYIFLARYGNGGEAFVVDPGEADGVLGQAKQRGWRITHILNTHWHADHTGGNVAVKAATGAELIGPAHERNPIPGLDRRVAGGDRVTIGATAAEVIDTPGHTAGHIAFHFPADAVVFAGDTLFALGCGRLFEGTAAEMWTSLQRLAALAGNTGVYCAHEYTQANARFALHVDPDNPRLRERATAIDTMRARGEPTVPTTICLELETNPFLRAGSAAHFAELRAAKDRFRG